MSKHPRKLLSLTDTPESIARGFAIGIFFGFIPLLGFKTLLSLCSAWALRSNKLAAVIGVTLHDVILPFAPILLRVEYDIGFWLLSNPHRFPPSLAHLEAAHQLGAWLHWKTLFTTGGPLLLGSTILALPVSVACYGIARFVLNRSRAARNNPPVSPLP